VNKEVNGVMKRLCDDCYTNIDDGPRNYYSIIFISKDDNKRYYARDVCPNCYNEIFKDRKRVAQFEIPKFKRR